MSPINNVNIIEEDFDEYIEEEKNRDILRNSRITCDEINFSNRDYQIGKYEFPCIDILTRTPFTPGDTVEISLNGINFDWINPELALYIQSRRFISVGIPLNETKTSLFMLDKVITYDQRKNSDHKLIFRTFNVENNYTEEQKQIINRIRGTIIFEFIHQSQIEEYQRPIDRIMPILYNSDDNFVNQTLDQDPFYKLENYN